MQTYYDLLKVEKTADEGVIEATLDDQYTKWRGLVTHHDPSVREQAQQALTLLEEIRTVLLDPNKRSVYDAAISPKQENMAGLADPDMILVSNPMQGSGMAPPRPRPDQTTAERKPELDRTDAWICADPKCNKANQIGTIYCEKCGKKIGLECPNCNQLVEMANKFCSYCGVNKVEYFSKKQAETIKDLERQLSQMIQMRGLAESDPRQFLSQVPIPVKSNSCLNTAVVISLLVVGAIIGISAESSFLFLLIGLIAPVTIAVLLTSNNKKKSVATYIEDVINPQIELLQEEMKDVQKARYGDKI